AVDVAAPVLGEHHAVLDARDAAEELALLIGQHGLRAIVLGAGPRVAHLGHVVLPGQTGGEALGVQGNHELGHWGSPWWLEVHVANTIYTKPDPAARVGEAVRHADPFWDQRLAVRHQSP